MLLVRMTKPSTPISIYILDKTVRNKIYNEHLPFFWVLNNYKFVKKDGRPYNYKKDYYGVSPAPPGSAEPFFFKRITIDQVDSFSNYYDALYYCDAFGMMSDEWFGQSKPKYRDVAIDAGIKQTDYLLLKEMAQKKKLVICEFNVIGSPTSELNRVKLSELYGIKWNGWYGKYFNSLKFDNNEIPEWIKKDVMQTDKSWRYSKPGIILINPIERPVILEFGVELHSQHPYIDNQDKLLKELSIVDYQPFTEWFEIIEASDTVIVEAKLVLPVNPNGNKVLLKNGLKNQFPLIVSYQKRMYYIAGDFSYNRVFYPSSYLYNYGKIKAYIEKDPQKLFFWSFYKPFISGLLVNYMSNRDAN